MKNGFFNGLKLNLLLILLVVFLSYANSFHNDFLYDDEHYLLRNSYIRDFSRLREIFTSDVLAGSLSRSNFYRPMQIFFYVIVYSLFGLKVFGFHLLNFLLHLGNGWLVYLLALRLFSRKAAALACALLFVCHPIHTEAVTYINGTADPLSAFFALAALLLYLRGASLSYIFSFLLFALSLLSKETLVVFPLLLVAVDIYRRRFSFKNFYPYLPYLLLALLYILLRLTVFNFTNSLSFYAGKNIYTENLHYRFFTFLAALMDYCGLLLFPLHLRYDRQAVVFISLFNLKVLFSFLWLLAAAWLVYRSLKKGRIFFLGFSWFYLALLPVSGIVPINGFVMEHWLYFPSVGIFLLAGYLLGRFKTRARAALLLAVLALFCWRSALRNRDWRNAIVFYSRILEHNPGVGRVHNNLGMAYADKGMLKEAVRHYQAAIALEDNYAAVHHNLGQVYLGEGRINDAIEEHKKAIAIEENFIYSHRALQEIYDKLGMAVQAEKEKVKIEQILSGFKGGT